MISKFCPARQFNFNFHKKNISTPPTTVWAFQGVSHFSNKCSSTFYTKLALDSEGQFFLKMMLRGHIWMGGQKNFRVGGNLPWMMPWFYVTTANNSFQPLSIFSLKELHLTCCIGLELNIVTWSTKIIKVIRVHPPWLSATLATLSWGPKKNISRVFFCIRFYAFNVKLTKWS